MGDYRIYLDESGTHDDQWLIIGALFVPDHAPLHHALRQVKENEEYFNNSEKRKSRYKETHFAAFRNSRDVRVAEAWIDEFIQHSCFFRAVIVDMSLWNPKYFGGPFDPEALKRRRAYKKWTEMLLQPEFSSPLPGQEPIRSARVILDRLFVLYGYDVLDALEARFEPPPGFLGRNPYIASYEHVSSWKDANQCLQLCDVLVGCLYQELVPSRKAVKQRARAYLEQALKPVGVDRLAPGFWRGFHSSTLRKQLPKFSAWFWLPSRHRK